MAYLNFTTSEEKSTCFKFIGANSVSKDTTESNLAADSYVSNSILASDDGGFDYCSFYSGPSDSAILAFGESYESCGSIAYSGGSESCGSIAYSGGGESCGSVASSSGSSFSGGCSYSC